MKSLFVAAALATSLVAVTTPATAKPGHCPPGLAKKSPACVPPGQAKKGYYRVGDRYDRDDDRIYYPRRYRLPPLRENEGYYRNGTVVYRVDEQTRRVIELILLTDLILSN